MYMCSRKYTLTVCVFAVLYVAIPSEFVDTVPPCTHPEIDSRIGIENCIELTLYHTGICGSNLDLF